MDTQQQAAALGALTQNSEGTTWLRFTPIAASLIGFALLGSGLATIGVLAGYSPIKTDVTTAIWLLNLDLVLALALIAVLARKMVSAWVGRRHGSAGTSLHIRLVVSFSLVAVIPALLVAAFSGLF